MRMATRLTASHPISRILCPQFYGKDGASHPATVIALEGGNVVTQVKTQEKDGYVAVQVRS